MQSGLHRHFARIRLRLPATVACLGFLVAVTGIVFAQSIHFEFLSWDDQKFVVRHLIRLGGLDVDSFRWSFANQENGWLTPLPYLSLLLDLELHGLAPGGFHLTNVLIHLGSTVTLFWLLERATGQRAPAVASAFLFAVHPLHVEPVVWITGRWELLCGLFWIGGLACYVRYCEQGERKWLCGVVVAYVLALLSKPMALTFPFALLLFDYWPLERIAPRDSQQASRRFRSPRVRELLTEKIALFLVMAVALATTWTAKTEYLHTRGMVDFQLSERLLNGVNTYAVYFCQVLVPTGLSFFYPHPALSGGLPLSQLIAAASLVLAITSLVLLRARQERYLLVGWLWYLGVFVPAIGLLQVDHHARADRYTYLPLIGIFVAGSWALFRSPVLARRRWLIAVGGLLLVVLAHRQASHWRADSTLFTHGVHVDARNYKALTGLGTVHARRGEYAAARDYYRQSRAACPWDRSTVNNLAIANFHCGDLEATAGLLGQWKHEPEAFPARYLLPISLVGLDRAADAVGVARQMVQASPSHLNCRAALAISLDAAGRRVEAETECRRVLAAAPDHPQCQRLLAALSRSSESTATAGEDTEVDHERPQSL